MKNTFAIIPRDTSKLFFVFTFDQFCWEWETGPPLHRKKRKGGRKEGMKEVKEERKEGGRESGGRDRDREKKEEGGKNYKRKEISSYTQ